MARIKYYDSVTQQWVYGDMAVCLPSSRLPAEYQEVEYIESDGTGQYIDTGVPCNEIYEICGDIKFNAIQVQYFGTYYSDGLSWKGYSFGIDSNNKLKVQLPNYSTATIFDNATTNRFKFYVSEILGSCWADTTRNTINVYAPTTTANYFLFARNNAAASPIVADTFCNMRVYRLALKGQNNLISHDFIPCYRKADSVIGMYDLVNGTFYTNAGSGTFTKGADV